MDVDDLINNFARGLIGVMGLVLLLDYPTGWINLVAVAIGVSVLTVIGEVIDYVINKTHNHTTDD